MKTAAAYIRVSTDDQLEFSPDSQLKVIRDYAEKNGIILLEDCIFIEDGGKSGKSMAKRDRFLELIALSKKKPKPFDYILLWKFSRFARNQEESIVLKSMLKKNGIEVISISEPLPEGPFGDLVQRVIEWSDAYYLVNLSQEVKRGMKEKASRGLPVVAPPIGYDMIDGQYIPNEKAELIKQIFADYRSGMGFRAIATKYSALGLKTKRGNPMDNRGIEYILRNPVYIGKIRWSVNGRSVSKRNYNDENIMIIDGKHTPIISAELFEEVQKMIADTKKQYGKYQRAEQPAQFMLKGLVRCSSCNATLVFINHKSPSMQCHNYARGSCSVSHSITINKANKLVTDALQEALNKRLFYFEDIERLSSAELEEKSINRLIENENNKLKRITASYQDGIDTLEEYKQNKQRILENIEKLKASAIKPKPMLNKTEYSNKVYDVLKVIEDPAQTEATKNKYLRSILSKIVFNKATGTFRLYFH